MGKKILIVGDCHAKPFWDKTRTKTELVPWKIANARFDALGAFIVHHKPDIIIQMGDWYDFKSISSYDKGKRSNETERLEFDIEAVADALGRVEGAIRRDNETRMRKLYKPRKIFLLGNHENRYIRLVNDQPMFAQEGLGDRWHLQADPAGVHKAGWEVYPFLEAVNVEGIHLKHYWTTGIMGKPISGEYPAETMLKLVKASCIGAHSHLFSFATRANDAIGRINAMVAGCFFGFHEDYAGPANSMWWRGLVMLNNVSAGDYDLEMFGYDRIMKEFHSGEVTY